MFAACTRAKVGGPCKVCHQTEQNLTRIIVTGRGESSGKRNGGFPVRHAIDATVIATLDNLLYQLDDKQHGNQEWIRGNQALRVRLLHSLLAL